MDLDRSARVWGAIKTAAHDDGTSPTLLHAVRACAAALTAVGAGVALTRNGGLWEPLVASSPEATELDELQFTLGEGPSDDAVANGTPVLESDLSGFGAGRRWPAFAAGATERDVGAAFAFPVGVGAARVGVLTVYRRERGPLSAELLQDALVYADAVLVLALDDRSGISTDADQLIAAAFSARRAEVHQAAGVVAAQLAISVTDALARLRAHAYSSGLSLQEVAAETMAGHLRLETDERETGSQHAELDQEEDS
ncbi:ANTAR domain-containing protein [Kribbella sp. NPDC004536]|uniref:ANTAR domain-containing protein n=1 Tax=Kribbella sp. NPDC004536 TaxID=3364106 RepID=UPI0036BE6851